MLAKIKHALAAAAVLAAGLAHKGINAALAVGGSTKGVVIFAEFKRALTVAAAASGVAAGAVGFLQYLASDQTFIAAVVPFVQLAAAKVGLVLPGIVASAAITFALTQTAALAAYFQAGKKPATVGTFMVEAGSPDFGFPLIEVKATGQDLASLGGQIAAKYGTSVRIMRDGDDPHEPYCIDVQVPARADEHALFDAIRADFPGTAATLYV